jgi:hypothetical protein
VRKLPDFLSVNTARHENRAVCARGHQHTVKLPGAVDGAASICPAASDPNPTSSKDYISATLIELIGDTIAQLFRQRGR